MTQTDSQENSRTQIYLDHNATTQALPEVIEAVTHALRQTWANPSSVHRAGQLARQQVELARQTVAQLINANTQSAAAEIVFTSGGTESTNLAINGTLNRLRKRGTQNKRNVIITSAIEHSAVREPLEAAESSGDFQVTRIPVDQQGVINQSEFQNALTESADRIALISIQSANNETGVIQPLADLVAITKQHDPRAIFHTDAIQGVGKIPTDVQASGIDLLSLAGHKFHGPPGVGALYIRRGLRLTGQQLGGPHERDRRGGTENVPAILGLAVAAKHALDNLSNPNFSAEAATVRDQFEKTILEEIPNTSVNGINAAHGRLWNTSNIAFDRLEAEAILIALSEHGLYASAGAACSSGSLDPSPVLRAMQLPETVAHGSIRFSFSDSTTQAEADRAVKILKPVISRLSGLL